jgi:hypothetical protein
MFDSMKVSEKISQMLLRRTFLFGVELPSYFQDNVFSEFLKFFGTVFDRRCVAGMNFFPVVLGFAECQESIGKLLPAHFITSMNCPL